MSAIANIVLTDAEATPVDHTFIPQQATPQLSVWSESAGADQPYLRNEVVATYKAAKSQNEVSRSALRLNMPLFTINGDGLVVNRGIARAIANFTIPSDMTSQERDNLVAMFRDLVDEAVTAGYVDGDPAF